MKLKTLIFLTIFWVHSVDSDASLCVLFSDNYYDDAKTFFRAAQYDLRLPSDTKESLALQELIIHGFHGVGAEKICKNTDCRIEELVNKQIGIMKLRPAHIAAMMGDANAIEWLADNGAQLSTQDAAGFTPAHFAALQPTRHILALLEERKADVSIRNKWGAKPEELWQLTHLVAPSRQKVNIFDHATRKPTLVDGDTFCVLTKTRFVERIKQTPRETLENWLKNEMAATNATMRGLTHGLDSFRSWPDHFYIKSIRPLWFSQVWTAQDYKLFAYKDFAYGDIVDVYVGIWKTDAKEVQHHVNGIDATSFRGYLPFAADGFPNIVIVPFANKLGLKDGNVAIAIRPILPGDAIVWDYSGVEVKFEVSIESDPNKLDAFLDEYPLEKLMANFKGFDSMELESLRSRVVLNYIARSAPVYLRLIAEEKMSLQQMKRIAQLMNLQISSKATPDGPNISILDQVFTAIERHFTNPSVRAFFSKKAREGNVQILLATLQDLATRSVVNFEFELEIVWQQTHQAFCAIAGNSARPGCQGLSLHQLMW